MKYKFAAGLIGVITFFAIWEQLGRILASVSAPDAHAPVSYLIAAYHLAVAVVLFLFVAGYANELESKHKESERRRQIAETRRRHQKSLELLAQLVKEHSSKSD